MIFLNRLDMWHIKLRACGPWFLFTYQMFPHDSTPLTMYLFYWVEKFHGIGPFTFSNFMNLPYQIHKSFTTLWFLHFQLLASRCSLVPLCFVFKWKPLALMSIFHCSSITIPQSQEPVLLWTLITIHQSKQHKPNVTRVRILVDLRV